MRYLASKEDKNGFIILIARHNNIKFSTKIKVRSRDFDYQRQAVIRDEKLTKELYYIRERLEAYIKTNRGATKDNLYDEYTKVQNEINSYYRERETLYDALLSFHKFKSLTVSDSYYIANKRRIEYFKSIYKNILAEQANGEKVASIIASRLREVNKVKNSSINTYIAAVLKPYFQSIGQPIKLKLKQETPEVKVLGLAEIEALERKNLPTDILKLVRDLFLLQFYAGGLKYSELEELNKLKPSDIYITVKESKTKKSRRLKINGKVHEILRKYNYKIEVPSVVSSNIHLKKVGKGLTTHCARRSFLNYAYRVKGIDLVKLQKISGHASVKTLSDYLRISEDEIDKAFDLIW